MSNTVVWFDVPVSDLDRAMAFYAAVCARGVEKVTAPGFTFGLFQHEGNDVGGCLFVPEGEDGRPGRSGPLVYFNVEGRLDAALAAVAQHGGQVLQGRHSIGPHGWRAVVLDSEGNRVALHSQAA